MDDREQERRQRDLSYRRRWPRAVPALDAELAAAQVLHDAEQAAMAMPGPETETALAAALKAHHRANLAYRAACRHDIAAWEQAHPECLRSGDEEEEDEP